MIFRWSFILQSWASGCQRLSVLKAWPGQAIYGQLTNEINTNIACTNTHNHRHRERERDWRLSNYAARMPSAGFFVNSSKLAHTHSPTHTHIFSNQMTRIGGVWPRNRWWPIRVSLAHTIHQFERNVRFVRLAMIPFVQLLQLKPNQLTHIWLNGQSNYAQNKNFARLNRQCSLRIERIFFFLVNFRCCWVVRLHTQLVKPVFSSPRFSTRAVHNGFMN